ncbi:MAG: beta-ketoacyl synthase N-terminal-like domain-containing protein, partial [Polyangiaceae bacterium]
LSAAGPRVGLVVGSTTGGLFETELLLARLHADPRSTGAIQGLRLYPLSGAAETIDRSLGPFVRTRTISSACSSGANALVVAAAWLATGEVDAVLAGGCDSLCRLTVGGFNALGALDSEPCRPFDRRRKGTSLGEGAGFLVLERRRRAVARGAAAIAELAAWTSGAEAFHITNPEPSGAEIASLIASSLAHAGLEPGDVDYVNAHGTGTRANDAAEAAALRRALGGEASRVPVSSSKGQIGHTLAAAGAIEAVITALVVSRGVIVPTGGLDEPDAEIGLVHVPHVGRDAGVVRAALSNAFGFGGMNAVLAFRRVEPGAEGPVTDGVRRVVLVAGCAVDGSADEDLDVDRSRRFDRAARLATDAALRTMARAGVPARGCGVVMGTAFGTVDGTAAFMNRVATRGPRFASPADFPNLLPSTSAGHISIYAGFTGPVFALVDPGAPGEAALLEALRLVAGGVAPRMLAGCSDWRGGPVVEALARIVDPGGEPQGQGAAVLLVEDEEAALTRQRPILGHVARVVEWRGPAGGALDGLEPPPALSRVFVSRGRAEVGGALASSSWAASPVELHQGHGLSALLAAAGRLAARDVDAALVLGGSSAWGFGVVLSAAPAPPAAKKSG